MSTLNSTGSWYVGSRPFETSLSELREWRDAASAWLADYRRWALVARLIDEQTAARFAHLERRLAAERLTIAFVAEYSRGKSELINALFFADLGARLLPAGKDRTTLCATEILHDPSRPPSIRVLPIETREGEMSLREHLAQSSTWKEIALDPADPSSLAAAFEVLSESQQVTAAEAANLGFDSAGAGRMAVPRWRYAVVNFPHPLLKSGLAILDTPGLATLSAEPELTLNRVPDADAIVFMVSAETGATPDDCALWGEHIAPIGHESHTRFIVLNKIDSLREGGRGEAEVLSEIDRRVRATADQLGVDPTRIFALSARQGLAARMAGDRDGLMRSRLYRLEQSLSQGLLRRRRHDHATAVGAETRAVLAETEGLLESRRAFASGQLQELNALQGKNQKLVETLARKANQERGRIEDARQVLAGLRSVHNRYAEELTRVLDPQAARAAGMKARSAVLSARFSGDIGGALDGYFRESRGKLARAVEVIGEVEKMMTTVSQRFREDYGMGTVEAPPFATNRFAVELDRLEEHCTRDFRNATSLIIRRRKTLGAIFFDTVALKVINVFEIADREVRSWMNAFIRPLDTQLQAFQDQTNMRIEGMGRIQNAETDLVVRVSELEAIVKDVEAQAKQWEAKRDRLLQLLDVERDPSLA
ncbi:dynamin family protein [Usitatibacter palustris]|uniref:Dynamin N-terminal domain-containing protein n=1 Tax=Usitatibacter palustris TaxID=2732487 RepID=A0A6M4H2T0_9PROT|nr:dynamin family protein [Usitatibacter palustris]QJR13635.1 hypothetical protein DSM104440_00419 [Usitatibacter palustris]